MPLIRVSMFPGRTADQKAELVSRLTDTFLDVCGRPGQSKDGVWVLLEEIPAAHWGIGGQVSDRSGTQSGEETTGTPGPHGRG